MELRELIPGPLPSSHPIEDWFPLVRVNIQSLFMPWPGPHLNRSYENNQNNKKEKNPYENNKKMK